MGCAGLKPDYAVIADEAKDTEPVNGIGEILSTTHLVPEDPRITAVAHTIPIAGSSKIDGQKTVFTSNKDQANHWYCRRCTEKDNILGNTQSE